MNNKDHKPAMEVCDNCETMFDADAGGHEDEATGLKFCCAECEVNYDLYEGLPDNYIRPRN